MYNRRIKLTEIRDISILSTFLYASCMLFCFDIFCPRRVRVFLTGIHPLLLERKFLMIWVCSSFVPMFKYDETM